MMRDLSYVVLAFGVVGIALGLYGWLFPAIRERIAAFLNNDEDISDDESKSPGTSSREGRWRWLVSKRAAAPSRSSASLDRAPPETSRRLRCP